MNWVTIIWSISAAVPLTLGAVHLGVWLQDRRAWANLLFSVTALAIAVFAGFELALMHARTATQFAVLLRWGHVPLFVTIVSLVGFIRVYFRAGRAWLAWTVIGLRVVVLGINFFAGPCLDYRQITGIVPVRFLGVTISLPEAVPSHWAHLGEGSGLLALVFVLDASISLWRRGGAAERRRALLVGGSVVLFVLLSLANAVLVTTGALRAPYFLSLFVVLSVASMGYELSRGVIRAARMAEELREHGESMGLAADAAQMALWRWDILRDVIWVGASGRGHHGIPDQDAISLEQFLQTVHPDDREATWKMLRSAMEGERAFRIEYRVVDPGGATRWIAARGKVEFNGDHKPVRMLGVSIDITERKAAELEAVRHRRELAHLTRVTTLSELSGSLAHELNQPLGIILTNAQAAQRLLVQDPPDVAEVREILADIVAANRHAGEVIQRLRTLLRRSEASLQPLALNDAIEEVLQLTGADLIGRGVTVVRALAPDLPPITGDRVQLQQLVLNLILNAADAMADNPPGSRRLYLNTERADGKVRASVQDEGSGLPADVEPLFQPFFTTKPHGLGMGLPICRSIVEAHHGQLWAEPHPARGAVFHFELPVAAGGAQ